LIALSILISLTVLSLLVSAWALSWSARVVGSSRARFGAGLCASLLLFVVATIFAVVSSAATAAAPLLGLVIGWALLALELGAFFLVLRTAFKLTVKRAFAPFGVYLALIAAQLVLTIFIVKPFLAEAFVIPTESMSPTIEPGDRLVVDKLVGPKRLDLVAYWSHDDHPDIYCKRLIGLPGERIRFDQGALFVNDQQVTLPSVLTGRCHAAPAALPPDQARYRDGESIALGADEYFFIGDNVDVSLDSRLAGPSHASSLVGVVDFVYWPLNKARLIR
jgi:signal peptidase I